MQHVRLGRVFCNCRQLSKIGPRSLVQKQRRFEELNSDKLVSSFYLKISDACASDDGTAFLNTPTRGRILLHPETLLESLELAHRKRLREDIRDLINGRNMLDIDLALSKLFPGVVKFDVKMLGSFMMNRVRDQ